MDHITRYSTERLAFVAVTTAALRPLILIVSIVRFALLIRLLPLHTYGVFIVLSAVVTQFDFMDFGMRQGLQRYIPEFLHAGRRDDIARAVTATFLIMLAIGIAIGLFVAGAGALGKPFFFPNDVSGHGMGSSIYVSALALAILWPMNTFRAGLEGMNNFNETMVVQLGAEMASTAFAVTAALWHWPTVYLFSAYLAPQLGMQFIFAWRLHALLERPPIRFDRHVLEVAREIFHYSKWVAVGQFGSAINSSLDKIVVAFTLGMSAVPIYDGLRSTVRAMSALSTTLNSVLLPTGSHRLASGGVAGLSRLVIAGTRAQVAFVTPFVVMATVFAAPLLWILADHRLVALALPMQIGQLLFLGVVATKVLNRVAFALPSYVRYLTLYGLLVAVMATAAIYIGGRFFGVSGAFLGPIFAPLVLLPMWLVAVTRRLELSLGDYLLQGVLAGAAPSLAVLALLFPFLPWISTLRSVGLLLAIATPLAILTIGVSLYFGTDDAVRGRLFATLQGPLRFWPFRPRNLPGA